MTKFESLKPRDFEDYLAYIFMEEVPEAAGDKDTFEHHFDAWVTEQDTYRIIGWADLWKTELFPSDITDEIKRRKNAVRDSRLTQIV